MDFWAKAALANGLFHEVGCRLQAHPSSWSEMKKHCKRILIWDESFPPICFMPYLFVQIAQYIWWNCTMYLLNLHKVFVQIVKHCKRILIWDESFPPICFMPHVSLCPSGRCTSVSISMIRLYTLIKINLHNAQCTIFNAQFTMHNAEHTDPD